MNNKKIGSVWEYDFCEMLKNRGYWVHFMSPNNAGAQPFDVIAVKNGIPYAIDCKTSVKHTFTMSRLEDNQKFAFEKWMKCGNNEPVLAIRYGGRTYIVKYTELRDKGSVLLNPEYEFKGLEFLN